MRAQEARDRSLRAGPASGSSTLWQGSPTAPRIALGCQLRRLREASGITRDAAAYTIRASGSKISRLERGRVASKERDVADLLTLYGVTDAEERERLLTLTRQANAPSWWREYGDVLPSWFETYLGLEQAASVIRVYEPQLVPGLLQTEDYARAIMLLRHLHVSHREIERRVALRIARQAFLSQPGAPDLWVALDEAALRRGPGNQAVQHGQLLHLIEMAQRPNVILQVVPLDAGAHAAAGGPFTVLRFSEPDLPDIVYLEHLTNAVYLDNKRDTADYLAIMDNLCIQAQSPTETVSFLQKIINEISPAPINRPAAVVAALAELDVRPDDRVLIMLPDGPGFTEAVNGVIQHGAVPLPIDPLSPAPGIAAAAAKAGARLVLVPTERIPALADLTTGPLVPIDESHGHWAAALRAAY